MFSRYDELFSRGPLRDLIFEEPKNKIKRIIQLLDKDIILFGDIKDIIESYKTRYSKG